jgi:hypothetical protein
MPIPIYLICSESGAIDETTKLASYFNLFEKMTISSIPVLPAGQVAVARIVPIRASSYWMKEDTDAPETKFQIQFIANLPNAPDEILLAQGEFQFTSSSPFARLNIEGIQLTQFFGPGMLRIEARVRRVGEEAWLGRQMYPILLEGPVPASSSSSSSSSTSAVANPPTTT